MSRWTASTSPTRAAPARAAERKGAIDTFDADGYCALLDRIREPRTIVYASAFDRNRAAGCGRHPGTAGTRLSAPSGTTCSTMTAVAVGRIAVGGVVHRCVLASDRQRLVGATSSSEVTASPSVGSRSTRPTRAHRESATGVAGRSSRPRGRRPPRTARARPSCPACPARSPAPSRRRSPAWATAPNPCAP